MGFFEAICNFIGSVLDALVEAAIWVIGFFIDSFADVVSWINNNLEQLRAQGVTIENVLNDSLLATALSFNLKNNI